MDSMAQFPNVKRAVVLTTLFAVKCFCLLGLKAYMTFYRLELSYVLDLAVSRKCTGSVV